MNTPFGENFKILFEARLTNFGAVFVFENKEYRGIYSEKKNLLEFPEKLDLTKGDIVERKIDGKKLKIVKHSDKLQGEVFIHRNFEVQEADEQPPIPPSPK